jgi:hypothetical protein
MKILKTVCIDLAVFQAALDRDVDANDEPTLSVFLDLETGAIIRLYAYDEDAARDGANVRENQDNGMRIASSPQRYVNIPGRTYADELKILAQFLESDWTQDEQAKRHAKCAYRGSIRDWISHFDYEGPVKAYFSFRQSVLDKLGKELLSLHGIEPRWTGARRPRRSEAFSLLDAGE